MPAKRSASAKKKPRTAALPRIPYSDATRQPLYCLIFLFPLVAAYEFGAFVLSPSDLAGGIPQERLVAWFAIRNFLAWFGAAGAWVPPFALIVTLLIWHILSRQTWQVRGWAPLLMAAESIVLTLPLLVLGRLVLQAVSSPDIALWKTRVVLALGAGIYEEMLFRFILVTVLLMLLVDLARLPKLAAMIMAGALAAVIFAACHVTPIGIEPFSPRIFLMRALSGGYLSLLYLSRGLGICTGTHVAYNLIVLNTAAA